MKTLEVLDRILKTRRLSYSSRKNYRNAFLSLARFSEEFPVSAVVLNEWVAQIEGLRDTTVRLYFRLVKAGADYAERAWKVENPFKEGFVEVPRVEKKKRRYFTIAEIKMIASACRNEFEMVLVASLIDSACRIGEFTGLKVTDVGEAWVSVSGKTGERKHRLDAVLCERLRALAGDSVYIFHNDENEAISSTAMVKRVRAIIERAGIKGEKLGAHTLRHTAANIVARETGSSLMVKSLLQHDEITTSMVYVHDVEADLAQSVSPLELIGKKIREDAVKNGSADSAAVQIGLGEEMPEDTRALVPMGVVVSNEHEYDVESAMYPEVADGLGIRPLLKSEDVRLLRRICVWYERNGESSSDKVRARDLIKRMLRKVK